MNVTPISEQNYCPFLKVLAAPIQAVYALVLKIFGYLFHFLQVRDWADWCDQRAWHVICGVGSQLVGIWAYGCRFLVSSNNALETCRGSCYWLIHRHFSNPKVPLIELAAEFEGGASSKVVHLHKSGHLPPNLTETEIWRDEISTPWPPMPQLDPGVYSFLVGYSEGGNHVGKAHRIAFFRTKEEFLLFDPDIGLVDEWKSSDWEGLLNRIATAIRTKEGGSFTLIGYRHSFSKNSSS